MELFLICASLVWPKHWNSHYAYYFSYMAFFRQLINGFLFALQKWSLFIYKKGVFILEMFIFSSFPLGKCRLCTNIFVLFRFFELNNKICWKICWKRAANYLNPHTLSLSLSFRITSDASENISCLILCMIELWSQSNSKNRLRVNWNIDAKSRWIK